MSGDCYRQLSPMRSLKQLVTVRVLKAVTAVTAVQKGNRHKALSGDRPGDTPFLLVTGVTASKPGDSVTAVTWVTAVTPNTHSTPLYYGGCYGETAMRLPEVVVSMEAGR
jgi:hypothetical protein